MTDEDVKTVLGLLGRPTRHDHSVAVRTIAARAYWKGLPNRQRAMAQDAFMRAKSTIKATEKVLRGLSVGQLVERRHEKFPDLPFFDVPEEVDDDA